MALTYFNSLALFLTPPLLILGIFIPRDLWRWLIQRNTRVDWKIYAVILIHILIALVYTTPWDNYLVANGVWWYHPLRVTGIRLGYVPIEEYIFFVLQTLMTGLWTVCILRYFSPLSQDNHSNSKLRFSSAILAFIVGTISLVLWLSGWKPFTYLGLILIWAIPPILLQLIFGADILWLNRRLLVLAISIPTCYLWIMDYVSIQTGIWAIDPAQTTGLMLGVLPLEEMVFFLLTNVIIGFGITLMLAPQSLHRFNTLIAFTRRVRGSSR